MQEMIEFFENGRIKSKGFSEGIEKQDKWQFYYKDGNIFKEENYKNGVLHGIFKRWFENGQLAVECEYSDGKHDGKWIEYYENGNKKEEGHYKDGKYFVDNFWDEKNEQTLKKGTGYKIEKYGALEKDIYAQYFENFKFIKEDKLSSLNIIDTPPR